MDDFVQTNERFSKGNITNVKEILLGLYPNEHMPSDHPPVAATVFINAKKGTNKRPNSDCDSPSDLKKIRSAL